LIYAGVLTTIFIVGAVLFLPVGIWATRVVRRREVKAAFAIGSGIGPARPRGRDLSPREGERCLQVEEVVFWPALWLLHIGGLLCVAVPLLILIVALATGFRHWDALGVFAFLAGGVVLLSVGIAVLRAGISLWQLRSY